MSIRGRASAVQDHVDARRQARTAVTAALARVSKASGVKDFPGGLPNRRQGALDRAQRPYDYGSEASDGHLGFLITTWLKAGRHTFTARAIDSSGRAASNTVTARVLSAPAPVGFKNSVTAVRFGGFAAGPSK
jgi:hypothetical protein